jgi:hypothetical protein
MIRERLAKDLAASKSSAESWKKIDAAKKKWWDQTEKARK